MAPLARAFYERSALDVARELIGAELVRQLPTGERIRGRIVETEAYTGQDMASHGRKRVTLRNAPMWGAPGHAYVYLCRGVHWMLNVVAEPEGQPAAVLLRAIEPLEGLEVIARRRAGRSLLEWTSGPGRLASALDVTGALNAVDMTTAESGLWIEPGEPVVDGRMRTGPRIGLGKTPEPWLSIPWRFWLADNLHVSR
jgi:DNA-3-methyladenine glycosylase